ncbi:hypothetical protein GDO78_016120 [Eleutherodactylus coqui]|uniref:Uncharacterized protein n=1 Tax=Eleutherodactylus coqui TaxID=57060 RepID=A0A8J6B6P0_ELECQ|nr:hypothetical protein GDO78_016120 [Eleutherodactylus coqui]
MPGERCGDGGFNCRGAPQFSLTSLGCWGGYVTCVLTGNYATALHFARPLRASGCVAGFRIRAPQLEGSLPGSPAAEEVLGSDVSWASRRCCFPCLHGSSKGGELGLPQDKYGGINHL